MSDQNLQSSTSNADYVFQAAAELFSVLSTPVRLRILSVLCDGEQTVNQLVERIGCSQPNLSQHLNVLYRSGIVAKRKKALL
jgi:DNA-binding transcriptional ArsR family regulator